MRRSCHTRWLEIAAIYLGAEDANLEIGGAMYLLGLSSMNIIGIK